MRSSSWFLLLMGSIFIIIAVGAEITNSGARKLLEGSDVVQSVVSKVDVTQEYDSDDDEYYDVYHVTVTNEYFGDYSFSTTLELRDGEEVDCYIQDDHILCTEYDEPIPLSVNLVVGGIGALFILIGLIARGSKK